MFLIWCPHLLNPTHSSPYIYYCIPQFMGGEPLVGQGIAHVDKAHWPFGLKQFQSNTNSLNNEKNNIIKPNNVSCWPCSTYSMTMIPTHNYITSSSCQLLATMFGQGSAYTNWIMSCKLTPTQHVFMKFNNFKGIQLWIMEIMCTWCWKLKKRVFEIASFRICKCSFFRAIRCFNFKLEKHVVEIQNVTKY